jgi:hypothetical protein
MSRAMLYRVQLNQINHIQVDVTLDDIDTLPEDAKSIAILKFGNADEFEIVNSEYLGDVVEEE